MVKTVAVVCKWPSWRSSARPTTPARSLFPSGWPRLLWWSLQRPDSHRVYAFNKILRSSRNDSPYFRRWFLRSRDGPWLSAVHCGRAGLYPVRQNIRAFSTRLDLKHRTGIEPSVQFIKSNVGSAVPWQDLKGLLSGNMPVFDLEEDSTCSLWLQGLEAGPGGWKERKTAFTAQWEEAF